MSCRGLRSSGAGRKNITEMKSGIDIGIVIALREEFRELHSQLPSPQAIKDPKTGVTDYLFQWGSPVAYQCAATFIGDMGLEKAALATERFSQRRQPATIVMLGIAGGIDNDVKLGDVVVATTVNNYLTRGKAVSAGGDGFTFEPGGDSYRCSDHLVRAVLDLEFAHSQLYQQWQETSQQQLAQAIAPEQLRELLQQGYLREKAEFIAGAIASGSVVGAAQEFIAWLKKINRNYLALEMEGGGMLGAVYSQADPQKTLILRGISEFGDERTQELDKIGKGGIRRYAMNNAIALLWTLLEAKILPQKESQQLSETSDRLSINPVSEVISPYSRTIDKIELLETLKQIFSPQFSELIFRLDAPTEYLPSSDKPQVERAMKLLNWAEAPGGCGLEQIMQTLEEMGIVMGTIQLTPADEKPDIGETPISDVVEPVTSKLTQIQRRHLEQQLKEQQKEYNYSNEEIEFLSDAEKREDLRPKELFRLKQQIADAKRKRDEAAQRIEELEKKLN